MSKNLSHRDWVVQQFNKYLESEYRNVLIHSSLIEGVLVCESGMKEFHPANRFLLCTRKINISEFCVFDEIRKFRNKLVHEVFKRKLNQNDIDKLRDNLMDNIHKAYRISSFLDDKVFKKYVIKRSSNITFNPTD